MSYIRNNSEFDFVNTFPTLGHPEHHFNKYPNHPWLKNKDDIKYWCEMHILNNNLVATVNKDLTVTLSTTLKDEPLDVNKIYSDIDFIKVQIREVNSFNGDNIQLQSLIGIPYKTNILTVTNNLIKNLEGMTKNVKVVLLNKNKIESLIGLPLLNNGEGSFLGIMDNEITSWDGFTNFEGVNFLPSVDVSYYSEDEIDNIRNLLITLPESIKILYGSMNNKYKINPFNDLAIKAYSLTPDLEAIRAYQKVKKNKDEINFISNKNDFLNNKKRKL